MSTPAGGAVPETRNEGQPLSLDEITARSGQRVTGDPYHGQRMFDVFVDDEPATVVPTRMHEPGWYLRARDGDPHYWNVRDPDALKRLCDQQRIRAAGSP